MAEPPSLLRSKVDCTVGVTAEPGKTWSSMLTWRRGPSLFCEHLGAAHQECWLAAVAHDLMACKMAFDRGPHRLEDLRQAPRGHRGTSGRSGGGGGGADGHSDDALLLNFPLDSYLNQTAFWAALKMPFGDLVLELRTSRALEKASQLCGAVQS
jgi:hypothetical protein